MQVFATSKTGTSSSMKLLAQRASTCTGTSEDAHSVAVGGWKYCVALVRRIWWENGYYEGAVLFQSLGM